MRSFVSFISDKIIRESSSEIYVNCKLPHTSPAAHIFGTEVRKCSSVAIAPLSVSAIPAFSTCSAARFGRRPSAKSTASPARVKFSAFFVYERFAPSMLFICAPVISEIPLLSSTPLIVSAMSRSSLGRNSSSRWTIVTFDPKFAYIEENSSPMYPPPTTVSRSGSSVKFIIVSETKTRVLFSVIKFFGINGSEPVLMTIFFASSVWVFPFASFTSTDEEFKNEAVPFITSTPASINLL